MIKVGSFVRFSWWSSYKAPSVIKDDQGHATWHEINPGDTGMVLCVQEEYVSVLFSNVDSLLRINKTMLEVI